MRPSCEDVELLKEEEILTSDIDSEDNLIALCKECHKVYDTQTTVEEYRALIKIKKTILKMRSFYESWGTQEIHNDILHVVNFINNLDDKDVGRIDLNYNAMVLDQKKDDTLSFINEIKIQAFIVNFFIPIREAFSRLEKDQSINSKVIFLQVKLYYEQLYSQNLNQNDIFEALCDWVMTGAKISKREKAEVLVSFFIQNCEVYSNVDAK